MREVGLISTYKEYLSCIRKWNDYSSDDQETLRAWYRKYYQENKEQEKQRYRQYYKANKKGEGPTPEESK
jgi:hypothetical protein